MANGFWARGLIFFFYVHGVVAGDLAYFTRYVCSVL